MREKGLSEAFHAVSFRTRQRPTGSGRHLLKRSSAGTQRSKMTSGSIKIGQSSRLSHHNSNATITWQKEIRMERDDKKRYVEYFCEPEAKSERFLKREVIRKWFFLRRFSLRPSGRYGRN
jgi:hypothetical protein